MSPKSAGFSSRDGHPLDTETAQVPVSRPGPSALSCLAGAGHLTVPPAAGVGVRVARMCTYIKQEGPVLSTLLSQDF